MADDVLPPWRTQAQRRKRTHSQMEASDRDSSPLFLPSSPSTDDFASASSTPSAFASQSSETPRRRPGDGFDFRRPVTTAQEGNNVIDLTSDTDESTLAPTPRHASPQIHIPAGQSATSRPPRQIPAARPPRFPRGQNIMNYTREVIEIPDDNAEQEGADVLIQDSPEVQIIRTRQLPVPHGLATRLSGQRPPPRVAENDDVIFVRSNQTNNNRPNRLRPTGPSANIFESVTATVRDRMEAMGLFAMGTLAQEERADNRATIDFAIAGSDPIQMDYDVLGFDFNPPLWTPAAQPPHYDAPPAVPEGFTRSATENDEIVCPNCDSELCTGKTETKKSTWISRTCGHIYCGQCVKYRSKAKQKEKSGSNEQIDGQMSKPFKICVVDGCDARVSSRSSMMQLFL
ncbi:hypothetical protein K402DRAFT_418077 [Aulographum hederae CBS 113979]|uniref:RING-type domain-containing protein n=1 Tax=Aulographum hederae CBS 113979 TaxID=1176131 RepID=A0A6G1HA84_9PEZI|nr:hypothetical protein K402DRAFT_418077 [Aulographum hederae CBS 113979]